MKLVEFSSRERSILFDPNKKVDTSINVNPKPKKNYEGSIRTVRGANLVYKRQDTDGNFDELWVYNLNRKNFHRDNNVKRAILAGTDIDPNSLMSDDESQVAEYFSVGNVQFLKISGLPQ